MRSKICILVILGGKIDQSDSESEDKEVMECLSRQTSLRRPSVLMSVENNFQDQSSKDEFLNLSSCSSNMSGLCQATNLLSSVKGGKSENGSDDDDDDGKDKIKRIIIN